jgi:hypothetical protein
MSHPIRVYLPATVPGLALLHRECALVTTEAYAVTAALREQLGETDEEDLSYAAYRLAAGASLRLLRADPAAPRRRVVVSADVSAQPVVGGDAGAVGLAGPVPLAAVAAIHVDAAAAEPAVSAALLAAGEAFNDEAFNDEAFNDEAFNDEAIDDEPIDDELEWYDVSELPQLLA